MSGRAETASHRIGGGDHLNLTRLDGEFDILKRAGQVGSLIAQ
jgi:hypothetical protein